MRIRHHYLGHIGLFQVCEDGITEIEEQLQVEMDESDVLNFVFVQEVPGSRLLDKTKVAQDETQAAKGIVTIGKLAYHISLVVYRTAKRYVQRHDHGFAATVVEETLREFYMADFGAWVWGGMKDASKQMWSTNVGLSGDKIHGGRYFLDGLSKGSWFLASPLPLLSSIDIQWQPHHRRRRSEGEGRFDVVNAYGTFHAIKCRRYEKTSCHADVSVQTGVGGHDDKAVGVRRTLIGRYT